MFRFEADALIASEQSWFSHLEVVRFQDVDAAQIVYFARLFDYVHAAYEGWLRSLGHPLADVLRQGVWAAPIRHAELTYRSPLRFGDTVRVDIVAAHLAESEVTLGYRLTKPEGKLVAIGQTVHTFVDPSTFRRIPIPGELEEALRAR